MKSFEVILVGLGAVGSATAYHLAQRGHKVMGFDQFRPPHTLGSSHGRTRIIREAYFEHPSYVPLIQRAYTLWSELAEASNRRLLLPTGGLMIGVPESRIVTGAIRSATEHRLPCRALAMEELRRVYPALHPRSDMVAVWESRAGMLFPEACIEAHLALAGRLGADLRLDTRVRQWEARAGEVEVWTEHSRFRGTHLVLCAGAWIGSLLPQHSGLFTVERQVQAWFEPKQAAASFQPGSCPIHIWEHKPGRYFYGFPDLGEGVKVAIHHEGERTRADALDREVRDRDLEALRSLVHAYLPDADGRLLSSAVCMYTNTPDEHFLIDRVPGTETVWIASPCSGHGFKFASAVGELLADRIEGKEDRWDLGLFRWRG